MRCAIYVRVSTSDGRQTNENQLLELREVATREKWNVTRIYQDQASGKSSDREAYRRMIADAAKKKFDVLLFWSLDRLSREGVLPTLNLLNLLSGYGVQYRSHKEQYLDSCGIFRDVILSLLATLAKQERIRLSERTKAGMERARLAGRPRPGKPSAEFDRDLAKKLRDEDRSYSEIAGAVGVSKATVARFFSGSYAKNVTINEHHDLDVVT